MYSRIPQLLQTFKYLVSHYSRRKKSLGLLNKNYKNKSYLLMAIIKLNNYDKYLGS